MNLHRIGTGTVNSDAPALPYSRIVGESPAQRGLAALFLGIPIWWLLGLQHLVWILFGVVFFLATTRTGRSSWPPLATVWFAFLFWLAISGLAIETSRTWMAYLYRSAVYWSATVLLITVWRERRLERLEIRWLLGLLTGFLAMVVLGGFAGVLLPARSWLSPFGSLLPGFLNEVKFVVDITTTQTSQPSAFLGISVPRPTAPFTYTNQWGSIFVLTVPFAVAFASRLGPNKTMKRAVYGIIVLGLIPLVFSLNRGAWLALVLGAIYYLLRVSHRRSRRRLATLLSLAIVAILIFASPLGSLVQQRLATPHSNQGRMALYEESIQLALESPLVGHGSPVLDETDPDSPSVGTHGQLWLVLVSQGFVGAVVFYTFFLGMIWTTRRWSSDVGLAMHVVLVMAFLESLYYELLPIELFLAFLAYVMAGSTTNSRFVRGDSTLLSSI